MSGSCDSDQFLDSLWVLCILNESATPRKRDSLVITGGHTHTDSVRLGDFLGTGQRLVCVILGLVQDLLTDWETQMDITGVTIVSNIPS